MYLEGKSGGGAQLLWEKKAKVWFAAFLSFILSVYRAFCHFLSLSPLKLAKRSSAGTTPSALFGFPPSFSQINGEANGTLGF